MTQPSSSEGLIGGRYRLERLLGEGGMGQVWQAEHVGLGAKVAVKLLLPRVAASERSKLRFANEGRVMAQLSSRHVVRVFDCGIEGRALPYLVMEVVDGETLGQRLAREGALAPATAARLLGQAAKGLAAAHALGIVHRDFKPENVLLCLDEDGELIARVLDFGMAKLLGEGEGDGSEEGEAGESALRTPMGKLLGTPHYMAPEQLRGELDVGVSADVWAFGVVAFECLTGMHPFRASSVPALFRRVLKGRAERATALRPSLPASFDRWFARCCASDPGARFPTIRAAADELSASLARAPRSGIRSPFLWATLGLLCAAAGAATATPSLRRRSWPPPAPPPPLAPSQPSSPPSPSSEAGRLAPYAASCPPAPTSPDRGHWSVQPPSLTAPESASPLRGFKADPYR